MNAASKRRSSVGFFPDRQAQSCAATLQFCVPDLTCHAALVSRELSPIWVWKPTEVYATMWRHLVANQGLNARSMERCGTLWSPEKPYRGGGPAVTDLLGGQVQVYFATTASSIEHVKSGKLRALAVTTATRVPALPDIPALAEFLPSYDASIYVGIVAPRTTPADQQAEPGNQSCAYRFQDYAANFRTRGRPAFALEFRIRQARRRGNREVGQGDPRGQRQGAVAPSLVGNVPIAERRKAHVRHGAAGVHRVARRRACRSGQAHRARR